MAETPPVSVRVRDLTKCYGPVVAVQGLNFEVMAGEIFGLLGPNGAGKTTTLECLLGLRRPDSGTITIEGVDALAQPKEARRLIGAQLQGATLQDKITPREALGLFASFYREPEDIGRLIERFGLAEKADAAFDSLSSGQRQRLFLALAFGNKPRLVVLDEPTAGLDPQSRRELHRLITGLRDSGRTVLLSTHDLEEARRLCGRIGIIDAGRLVAVDTPNRLVAQSRAPARIFFRAARPLAAVQLSGLPGVVSARSDEDGWVLGSTEVNRTVGGVARCLEAEGNELLDLQIHRPSLEDVFLELTGNVWDSTAPPRK